MYTVTFSKKAESEQFSRFFSTVRAARNWATWLASRSYVQTVSIYKGREGEMLVERKEAA